MSLRERLEAKPLQESFLTVRGEKFLVGELDGATRARLLADCRSKSGKLDSQKLEGVLLSACVKDPDDGLNLYSVDEWEKWDKLGSGFRGPLMAEVMRLNGLDDDDVGRELKNSDTTTS